MLTWALVFMMSKVESINGLFFLMSMGFDFLIVVAITACWWGKYLTTP
jgi:hypothetical protein